MTSTQWFIDVTGNIALVGLGVMGMLIVVSVYDYTKKKIRNRK